MTESCLHGARLCRTSAGLSVRPSVEAGDPARKEGRCNAEA
jgi:hypothetical protein